MLLCGIHIRTTWISSLSHNRPFSLVSSNAGLTWGLIVWRRWLGSLVISKRFDTSHLPNPRYQLCDRAREDWQQHIIPLGDVVPPGDPWACTYDYLSWFYKISYVIPPEEGQPRCGPVHLLSIRIQPQHGQPLKNYVAGGDYSCHVMQIGVYWFPP